MRYWNIYYFNKVKKSGDCKFWDLIESTGDIEVITAHFDQYKQWAINFESLVMYYQLILLDLNNLLFIKFNILLCYFHSLIIVPLCKSVAQSQFLNDF